MLNTAVIHNHPIHYKHLLFEAMVSEGLAFEVLFTGAGSTIRREQIPLKTARYSYRIGFDGPYEKSSAKQTIRFVWRSLSELNPATVIIGGYYDIAAWTAWTWSNFHRRPAIMWNETNSFDRPRIWWKEKLKQLFVSRLHAAHVYGLSNKEYLMLLGMKDNDIIIKRAVGDVARFHPHARRDRIEDEPLDLLYVGRLAPEKNLSVLLEAYAATPLPARDKIRLSIVGYGPEETKLRALAERLQITDGVWFEGVMTQAQLPARYSQADCFILPSLSEPWGLVALEAMLCRLPVLVSTQCGCARDLVSPLTGRTFSPFSAETITRLFCELSKLPREELRRMGDTSRTLAESYSAENCARIVARTVSEAISRRQLHQSQPRTQVAHSREQ